MEEPLGALNRSLNKKLMNACKGFWFDDSPESIYRRAYTGEHIIDLACFKGLSGLGNYDSVFK